MRSSLFKCITGKWENSVWRPWWRRMWLTVVDANDSSFVCMDVHSFQSKQEALVEMFFHGFRSRMKPLLLCQTFEEKQQYNLLSLRMFGHPLTRCFVLSDVWDDVEFLETIDDETVALVTFYNRNVGQKMGNFLLRCLEKKARTFVVSSSVIHELCDCPWAKVNQVLFVKNCLRTPAQLLEAFVDVGCNSNIFQFKENDFVFATNKDISTIHSSFMDEHNFLSGHCMLGKVSQVCYFSDKPIVKVTLNETETTEVLFKRLCRLTEEEYVFWSEKMMVKAERL